MIGVALFSFSAPASLAAPQTTPPEDKLDPGYQAEMPAVPTEAPPVARAITQVAPVSEAAVPIAGIRFNGADVPANVAAASQGFLGRPADTKTLTELAAVMSAAYKKSAVALFTLAIPSQDLSDGIVDVYIAEGRVAEIVVTKDGKAVERPLLRGYLDPVTKETPASRATLERGITLARRTQGTTVKPRVIAIPNKPGEAAVVLDIDEKKDGVAVGYDSRESRLIDTGRLSLTGFAFGTFLPGDALRGRLSATPDFDQSRAANLQYTTPIGENGLNLALAGAYQDTRPSSIDVEGNASFLSAGLSYPLVLDFHRELSFSGTIDRIESTNTALGSIIANERISAARLGAKGSWTAAKRSLSGNLTYSRGLGFGESRSSVPEANVEFNKIRGTGRFIQALGDSVFLRLSAEGQWTDDILPANERLLIGGADFGRGFDNGLVSFDTGYAGSIEPAWRPLKKGPFRRSELYLFADYADGSITPNGVTDIDLDLSSAGIGTRLGYKDFATLGIELAEPVELPYPGLSDDPVVTVSWSFKYQPK